MGWKQTIIMSAVVLILLQFAGIHPGIVIAALIVMALFKRDPGRSREGEQA